MVAAHLRRARTLIGRCDRAAIWCRRLPRKGLGQPPPPLVGQHEGGYTPFWFEIQSFAQPGENEVIVRVNNPPVKESVSAEDYLFGEIPHGKQDWYTRVSGIWQSVWVEARCPVYVSRLHVTPDLDAASARLDAELVHLPHEVKDWQLVFSVGAPDSGRRWAETAALEPGTAVASAAFALGEVVPWEPQRPALYVAAAELADRARAVGAVVLFARAGHRG